MLDDGARRALAATRFADVRWHVSIDSTNRALRDLARAGAPEGVVVAADHQSAGRGRLDRTWVAPAGSSLLLSVLLRPPVPVERTNLATALVGLSAADACAEVAGFRPLLKWPNDLVVAPGWRKLGGILAELVTEGGDRPAVVVGLGLNVNWPPELPPELAATATAANHVAGREVDRLALFVALLRRLDARYGALCTSGDWSAVIDEVRGASATLGRDVRVELPDGAVVVGRAVDLTDDGHLLVESPSGTRHEVTAGDVVHLRPA